MLSHHYNQSPAAQVALLLAVLLIIVNFLFVAKYYLQVRALVFESEGVSCGAVQDLRVATKSHHGADCSFRSTPQARIPPRNCLNYKF